MPYTPQEIESTAKQLADAGVAQDQIAAFIEKARSESAPAAAQPAPVAAPAPAAAPSVAAQMQTTTPIDAAYLRAAGIAGGGGFVGGFPITGPQALKAAVTGTQLGLEGGATILGQTVGLPGGPAGVSVGGNIGARFGNYLSQLLDYAVYDKPYSQKENEKAALMGTVPMVGPEELVASRLAQAGLTTIKPEKTIPQALASALETGGKFGTAGGLTEAAVETAYSPTGELPPAGQIAMAAGGPMALGTMAQFLQDKGSTLVDRAGRAMNALNFYRGQGIAPTPGMVDPRRFAMLEERLVREQPLGTVAKQREQAYETLSQNLEDIAPSTMQGSTMYEQMKNKMTGIADARKRLDGLGREVSASQQAADKALLDLNKTKEQYFADQTSAATKAFDDTIEAALQRARQESLRSVTIGQTGTRPDLTREATVKLIETVDDAYKTHWQRMYAPFPDKEANFDTKAIYDQAKEIFDKFMGKDRMPVADMARLGAAGDEPTFKASLDSLKLLRQDLLQRGKFGTSEANSFQGELKQLAGLINDEIDRQLPKAFGDPLLVDQYKKVTRDFARYSELRNAPGVGVLFDNPVRTGVTGEKISAITSDEVSKIANDIIEKGAGSEPFRNIRAFIAHIAADQFASLSINPEVAGRMYQHFNDIIRGHILWGSSKNGKVDAGKLIGTLDRLGNDPEALRLLGFGSQGQIEELGQLYKNHPQASKMTPDQWNQLFASPTFQRSLEQGGTLTGLLKPVMQASELQNQMGMVVRLQQAGRAELAEKIYQDALKNAEDLRISRSELATKLKQMEADPTFAVHKDSQLNPANYYDLIQKTTDTNITDKKYIKAIADSLRESPLAADKELLARWQRGYIKERLMTDEGTRMNLERVSDVFGGQNLRKSLQEMDVAQALLDPKQVDAIEQLAQVANRMRLYERGGSADKEKLNKLLNKPIYRGYSAMLDMIRRREYDSVAQALSNPDNYVNKVAINGQWLEFAGKGLKTITPSAARMFLPANQQQAPNSLLQFAQPQPSR